MNLKRDPHRTPAPPARPLQSAPRPAGPFELQRCEPRLFLSATVDKNAAVIFRTNVGQVVMALDPTAPQTVANFLQYVDAKLYDNTVIHRAVDNFVVQAGGYKPSGSSYTHIATFPPVVNEFSASRPNVRGTVAMAKLGSDPDSATSEFFVNVADNRANLDNQNGGFTTFARVIRGMGIVDLIETLPRSTVSATNAGNTTSLSDYPKIAGFLDVRISSATKADLATVTIGAGSTDKAVRFRDGDKTMGLISLAGPGAASIKLTGAGLETHREGNILVVRGQNLEFQSVDTTGTTLASNLILDGRGGRNHAIDIGDITASNPIGSITGPRANINGDVSMPAGVKRINLLAVTNAGAITLGSAASPLKAMPVDVNIGFLTNASVTSAQPIRRLITQAWEVTDFTNRGLTAPSIGTLQSFGIQNAQGSAVGFSADISVPGRIQNIGMRLLSGTISAGSIGSVTIGVVSSGSITATAPSTQGPSGIGAITIDQASNANIRSVASIGRVNIGTMNSSSVVAGVESTPSFGKFPNPTAAVPASGTSPAIPAKPAFADPAARIDSVRIFRGPLGFNGSRIAAPTIRSAVLGRVATTPFSINSQTGAKSFDTTSDTGLKADRIGSVTGFTQDGQPIRLKNLDTQAATNALVAARKLKLNRFSIVLI